MKKSPRFRISTVDVWLVCLLCTALAGAILFLYPILLWLDIVDFAYTGKSISVTAPTSALAPALVLEPERPTMPVATQRRLSPAASSLVVYSSVMSSTVLPAPSSTTPDLRRVVNGATSPAVEISKAPPSSLAQLSPGFGGGVSASAGAGSATTSIGGGGSSGVGQTAEDENCPLLP